MLAPVEKAAAYLQELEVDRLAAIAVSEEKAEEAMLIKARQEGFRQVMEMLGVTAVRSISEQIQLISYLRSNAFVGLGGKRLIQW